MFQVGIKKGSFIVQKRRQIEVSKKGVSWWGGGEFARARNI